MRAKSLLVLAALILSAYPLALCVQIAIDTSWGDAAFLDSFAHVGKRDVAMQVLADWRQALTPVALAFAILLTVCLASRHLAAISWLFPLLLTLSLISPLLPYVPLLAGITLAICALLFLVWSRVALS